MNERFKHKLAFIIPTKDRREDLRRLFRSMVGQTGLIGQIVLVDGGDDTVEDIVAEFKLLPIDYIRCYPPGFTKQKNAGAKALHPDMTLIGYLDDDLELEEDTLEVLMNFWETADSNVGGTSFHITNMVIDKVNIFSKLFGTNSENQGVILKSGFGVVVCPVEKDTEVEWLCGGATVWRREVVDKYEHDEWFAGYGHMDDIEYSSQVGASYKMFILERARCAHYERPITGEKNYVFGIYDIVNHHYLVKKYPSRFSVYLFYWAVVGKILGRLVQTIIRRDGDSWLRAKGYLIGFIKVLFGRVRLNDVNIK